MSLSLSKMKSLLCACFFGTVLEWYDFAVYGFLAPIIAGLFFPHQQALVSLLLTYSVFAMGYLVRPLGGMFFGILGDRIGRKPTLIITVLLMAIPTVAIGCLPTYQSVGMIAPILLIVLRFLQGLSAGGESIGAIIFVYEAVPQEKKAFATSFVFSGSGIGLLLGSLMVTLCFHFFDSHQMEQFGWRIPFFLAIISAIFGPILRLKTEESAEYLDNRRSNNITDDSSAVRLLSRSQSLKLLRIIFLFAPNAIIFYLGFIFMPAILVKQSHLPMSSIYLVNTIATMLLLVLCPVFGCVADRYHFKKILLIVLLCDAICCLPLYWLLSQHILWCIVVAQCGFAVLVAWLTAPLFAFVLSLLSTSTRYAQSGFAYNVSYSIFGGTAPLVGTGLVHYFNSFMPLAFYVILVVLVALWALSRLSCKQYNVS